MVRLEENFLVLEEVAFLYFMCSPFQKHQLIAFLKSKKLDIQNFRFEPEGLKTWTSRGSSGF